MNARVLTILAAASFVAPSMLTACAPTSDDADDPPSEASDSDLTSGSIEVLGSIQLGTSLDAAYAKTPAKYRAYSFHATKGDAVDFWVRSTTGGDAVGYILGPTFATLVRNDDADATTEDAHIATKIRTTGTYYVAFKDSAARAGRFEVAFTGPRGAPSAVGVDPFDPSSCTGPQMTFEEVTARMARGEHGPGDVKVTLATYRLMGRVRTCDGAQCPPWEPAKQVIGSEYFPYWDARTPLGGKIQLDLWHPEPQLQAYRLLAVDSTLPETWPARKWSAAWPSATTAGTLVFDSSKATSYLYEELKAPVIGDPTWHDAAVFANSPWSLSLTHSCVQMITGEIVSNPTDPNHREQYAILSTF